MNLWSWKSLTLVGLTAILGACGSKSNSKSGGGDGGPHYVNWSKVAAEFNPTTVDAEFPILDVEMLKVNIFGFDRDVRVIYSPEVKDRGILRLYRVFKGSASFGYVNTRTAGRTTSLEGYGSYSCSISVRNQVVTAVDGGCYVRLEIILPLGAQIEVYNVDRRISARFFPMDNESFLEQFDRATWAEDKFAVIENYLASYAQTKKSASLNAEQLGLVIHGFVRSEEKFRALRRLHSIVSDRSTLSAMIDNEFNYFDQKEARKICGLPPT